VNLQTLRYYERRELLAEPDRSPGGQRRLGAVGRRLRDGGPLLHLGTADRVGFA
jgi:hypothetical protein